MGKKFKRVPADIPISKLNPLNISCHSTKCEDGLHCFSMHRDMALKRFGNTNVCYECGIELIDWDRFQKNNIHDVKFIFKSLKNELIRHVYWHIKIEEEDLIKALQKGEKQIKTEAEKRMIKDIGIEKPYRGGFTPYYGNIIYYAQHATATCCRKCLESWHNIESGRILTKAEITFCTDLMMLYIAERVPSLLD